MLYCTLFLDLTKTPLPPPAFGFAPLPDLKPETIAKAREIAQRDLKVHLFSSPAFQNVRNFPDVISDVIANRRLEENLKVLPKAVTPEKSLKAGFAEPPRRARMNFQKRP